MPAAVCLLLAIVLPVQARPLTDDPAQILGAARRALAEDRLADLEREWQQRLARDSSDRAALFGLATAARLTYRYQRADSLYERLLPRDGAPPDPFAVHARLGYAIGVQWRGDWRRAEAELGRVREEAEAIGDAAARARALLRMASLRARTVSLAAARELLVEVEGRVPEDDLSLRALDACVGGSLRRSLSEVEAGAELAERAGDDWLLGACLMQLAQNQGNRGNVDSALALLGRADEAQRRARDRVGLAATLGWAGYYLTWVGAYGKARRMLYEAIGEGEASGNLSPVAWAYLNLANVSELIEDLSGALAQAERAAAMFERQGDRWGRAAAQATRADVAAAAGRFDEARAQYEAVVERYEELGNATGVVSVHTALADLALAERDPGRAKRELDAARSFARARGMSGWDRGLEYSYAEVALARGDLDAAERHLADALAGVGTSLRMYRTLVRRAELYARRGDIERAEADLREAIFMLDRWRAGLDRDGLRRYAFQIREHRYDPDLGVATILAAMVENGRVETAFRLAERQRGRELSDQLLRAAALAAGDGDSLLRKPPVPTALGIAADSVAANLPDSTALLEYVTGVGGEPTTLFVVTRDGLRAYALPPIDSLSEDVRRFRTLVSAGTDASALSRRLAGALLGPALSDLPAEVQRLAIVADGILHRLPFDVLRLEKDRFLVERFALNFTPSAMVALELWRRSPATGREQLLAMADPRYDEEAPATSGVAAGLRAAFAEAGGLPRLPRSRREAQSVARFSPRAVVRMDERASEAFLKRTDLRDYRILHFAAHAVVDDHSLARTALALAPGGGEDGFVVPGDLAALDLDADLVVLSGCRTAGGPVVRGEGVYGLAAPLLEAGARAVLATGWSVGDREAQRFSEAVYRQLAAGRTVSDALQAAKLEALGRGAPVSEWAAFTLVGDPFVQVPLEPPGSRWTAALVLLAAGALAATLTGLVRRRWRRGPLPAPEL